MDTRNVTLISVRELLLQVYDRAAHRYTDTVMDYLTLKKLNQLAEVILSDELARRMRWAAHDDTIIDECIGEVMARAPWHRGDPDLFEDVQAFVYEPLQVALYRILDDLDVTDDGLDVCHLHARSSYEYLIINEGDYRIHVWNRLAKNGRRQDGLQWWFDQGLYGFRIAEAWQLPSHGGAMGLDRSESD